MVEIICSNTTNGFSKDTLQKYENRSLSQKSSEEGKALEEEGSNKAPQNFGGEENHQNDDDWKWKKYHLGQIQGEICQGKMALNSPAAKQELLYIIEYFERVLTLKIETFIGAAVNVKVCYVRLKKS